MGPNNKPRSKGAKHQKGQKKEASKQAAEDNKIPVTVLTGFLGSGKTVSGWAGRQAGRTVGGRYVHAYARSRGCRWRRLAGLTGRAALLSPPTPHTNDLHRRC